MCYWQLELGHNERDVMTFNICWQRCSVAFCTLLFAWTASVHQPEKRKPSNFFLMAILKLVFMRFKLSCALLRDGWIVFLCLLSSAVSFGVIDECLMPTLVKEGAWDCGMSEGWVQACLYVLSHLPMMHSSNSAPKLVFHIFWFIGFWILLDQQGQTIGSQTCYLLPWVWLSRAAGIGFDFPSTVVLNGLLGLADTAVMLIEGTEVLPLCISFMVVKKTWAIPGRNDKSLVINFFYLHSWIIKKNAICECRNNLKILSHKE